MIKILVNCDHRGRQELTKCDPLNAFGFSKISYLFIDDLWTTRDRHARNNSFISQGEIVSGASLISRKPRFLPLYPPYRLQCRKMASRKLYSLALFGLSQNGGFGREGRRLKTGRVPGSKPKWKTGAEQSSSAAAVKRISRLAAPRKQVNNRKLRQLSFRSLNASSSSRNSLKINYKNGNIFITYYYSIWYQLVQATHAVPFVAEEQCESVMPLSAQRSPVTCPVL